MTDNERSENEHLLFRGVPASRRRFLRTLLTGAAFAAPAMASFALKPSRASARHGFHALPYPNQGFGSLCGPNQSFGGPGGVIPNQSFGGPGVILPNQSFGGPGGFLPNQTFCGPGGLTPN